MVDGSMSRGRGGRQSRVLASGKDTSGPRGASADGNGTTKLPPQPAKVPGPPSAESTVPAPISLHFPENVEGPEQSHFVRFDIKTLQGVQLTPTGGRTDSAAASDSGGLGGKLDGFLKRTVEGAVDAGFDYAKGAAVGALNKALPGGVKTAFGAVNALFNLADVIGGNQNASTKAYNSGSITLFTPSSMTESYKPNWGGEATGAVGGQMAGDMIANHTLSSRTMAALKAGGIDMETILEQGGAGAIGAMINQGNLGALVLKHSNRAVNPHMEMLFKGVEFRTFTYDFKLAPRNRREAQTVHDIVHRFKWAAAPEYYIGDAYSPFFVYPNLFKISYYNEDQLHYIGDCALTGITVNHAGSGTNATFYDDYPVETDLNLTFTEMQIMTKDAFERGF
tara:strand:- start:40762 stop:41943 length:1182 start_codon:yes stop_codon:yes gene_type:complete